MKMKGAFNYTSFVAICDAARHHGIDPLVINSIVHMMEWIKMHILVVTKSTGVLGAEQKEGFSFLCYGS